MKQVHNFDDGLRSLEELYDEVASERDDLLEQVTTLNEEVDGLVDEKEQLWDQVTDLMDEISSLQE